MKRSKYVHLSLAAAVSLAVAGCGSEERVTVSKTLSFESVKACTAAKVPVDVCSDAYMNAMAEHRRIAPTYTREADCEADFVEGYCQAEADGKFIPRLGGFNLTTSGSFTQAEIAQAQAQAPASTGGGGNGFDTGDFLTGMLIGNMLSNSGGRYYSEPVYRYRDDRGTFATSTLKSRIDRGTTFSKASSGNRQAYQKTAVSKPAVTAQSTPKSTIQAKPKVNVKSTVSRGGFGSRSAAKSGWGGGSRSFGG